MFSLPIKTSETKVSKSVYKYSQNLCFCLFTIIQSFLIIYDLSQSNIFAQREIIIKFLKIPEEFSPIFFIWQMHLPAIGPVHKISVLSG